MKEELLVEISANIQDIQNKLKQIQEQIQNVQKTESPFEKWDGQLSSVYKKLVSIVALLQGSALFGMLKVGTDFLSLVETTKAGFAGILTSIADIYNAQGRLLTGQEKFNASLELALFLQKELQKEAMKTTATYEELIATAQGLLAPYLAQGGDLQKFPAFVSMMTNSVKALGLPLNQIVQEARDLLSATIDMNSQLARSLGITNEMVKRWQEQGTLFEEIESRLQGFVMASSLIESSWSGLLSRAKEVFTLISAEVSKPLFEAIKRDLQTITEKFLVLRDGRIEIREDVREKLQRLGSVLESLYNLLVNIVKITVFVIDKFGGLIETGLKIFIVTKLVYRLADAFLVLRKRILASQKAMEILNTTPILSSITRSIAGMMPAITAFLSRAFSVLGIVIATAIASYDLGSALWNWLDKQTRGALTLWIQMTLSYIDEFIARVKRLFNQLSPFDFVGLTREEFERKMQAIQLTREAIVNEYKARQQAQEKAVEKEALAEFQASVKTKEAIKDRLESFQQERKLNEIRLQTTERIRKAYAQMLKSVLEAQKGFKEVEKQAILIRLDFAIEEVSYQEKKQELKARIEELNSLLKLELKDEDRERTIKEIQKLNEDLYALEAEYQQKRVELASNYIKELTRMHADLVKTLKDLMREQEKDARDFAKRLTDIFKSTYEPLASMPTDIRDRLVNILGISFDFTGLQELKTNLLDAKDSFNEFFDALKQGQGIETLQELKDKFIQARDNVLNFMQSLSPGKAVDMFKLFGFDKGFLPSRDMVAQRLETLFGFDETKARNMAEKFTQIFVDAQANVSRAFQQIPELSQFLNPEQLLGMQLKQGLTQVFAEDLKQQTEAIFNAMKTSIETQMQEIQNLIGKLQKQVDIPVRLDLSKAEEDYNNLVRMITNSVIKIPVAFEDRIGATR